MMIEDIIFNRETLEKELRMALSTMEKKDTVKEIRDKIVANQSACPHFSDKFNWAPIDDKCPYCGKQL